MTGGSGFAPPLEFGFQFLHAGFRPLASGPFVGQGGDGA